MPRVTAYRTKDLAKAMPTLPRVLRTLPLDGIGFQAENRTIVGKI